MEINTLKERRKSLGLTIYDIAESTNVSHSTVSRVENGIQGVSVESARGMAKAYNLALGDFIEIVEELRKARDAYVAQSEKQAEALEKVGVSPLDVKLNKILGEYEDNDETSGDE